MDSDGEPFDSKSLDYHDLDLSITIHSNEIELFEASTGKFIYAHPLDSHAQVSQVLTDSPEMVLFKGGDGNIYEVVVSLLGRRSILPTKDEYVRTLQFEEEFALGAHFGLYGWGLFKIKDDELLSLFFQETENLRTGLLFRQEPKMVILLGYNDGRIRALVVDPANLSSFDLQQAQIWSVDSEHHLTSLLLVNERLVSVHQSGHVLIRNPKTAELLDSILIPDTRLNCSAFDKDTLYMGTWKGRAIALNLDTMNVRWTVPLSQTSIAGCAVTDDGVCFVDNGNGIYWLDPLTGEKRREIQSETGVSSNPLQFKHTVVVGGAAHLLAFLGEKCIEKHYWEDNLIRSLCPHPRGVLVGNDNGNISLWVHGGLVIKPRPGYNFVLQKVKEELPKLLEILRKMRDQEEE